MIQVNRIYLIFNRLVTKKFLVDTSDRKYIVINLINHYVSMRCTICFIGCHHVSPQREKTQVSVSAMTYSASQKRLLLLHKSIKKRIMVIENPNPIPLEYPTLLEVLKKELAQDPNLHYS